MRRIGRLRPSLMLALLFGLACDSGPQAGSTTDFAATLPTAASLLLSMAGMPDPASSSVPGDLRSALNDDSAPGFHDLTQQAMDAVNRDVALIVVLLDAATATVPVMEDPDSAVWRGVDASGTEEHVLVIRRMPEGYYDASLATRSTSPAGAPWRPRLAGSYTPNTRPAQGQGSMWIDLDTDLDDTTSGTLLVLWSTLGGEREVAVFDYDLATSSADVLPRNGTSGFHEHADRSGTFTFSGTIEIPEDDEQDEQHATLADALILSRWTAEAEGRADAHVTGSVAVQQGFDEEVASQCWKSHGKVTTFDAVDGRKKDPGKDGKIEHKTIKSQGRVEDCPFLEPADALLPSRPARPPAPTVPPEAG